MRAPVHAHAQTKELARGQYRLDSRYARARFTTPYFAQFLTDIKEGTEAAIIDARGGAPAPAPVAAV
jgi:hypothetical protein